MWVGVGVCVWEWNSWHIQSGSITAKQTYFYLLLSSLLILLERSHQFFYMPYRFRKLRSWPATRATFVVLWLSFCLCSASQLYNLVRWVIRYFPLSNFPSGCFMAVTFSSFPLSCFRNVHCRFVTLYIKDFLFVSIFLETCSLITCLLHSTTSFSEDFFLLTYLLVIRGEIIQHSIWTWRIPISSVFVTIFCLVYDAVLRRCI